MGDPVGDPTSYKILCPNDLTIKEYPTKYLRFIERNMDLINWTTFRFEDYDSLLRANQNLQTEKLSKEHEKSCGLSKFAGRSGLMFGPLYRKM